MNLKVGDPVQIVLNKEGKMYWSVPRRLVGKTGKIYRILYLDNSSLISHINVTIPDEPYFDYSPENIELIAQTNKEAALYGLKRGG